MENKLKHLEMIQGIINRMASNSFALKGWSVTLVAGIFALSSKDANEIYFLIAYIPIIVFWFLDAYYLLQERLFRSLYGKVRRLSEEKIDFDMNIAKNEFKSEKNTFCACMISVTEAGFYIPLSIVTTAVIILTHTVFVLSKPQMNENLVQQYLYEKYGENAIYEDRLYYELFRQYVSVLYEHKQMESEINGCYEVIKFLSHLFRDEIKCFVERTEKAVV